MLTEVSLHYNSAQTISSLYRPALTVQKKKRFFSPKFKATFKNWKFYRNTHFCFLLEIRPDRSSSYSLQVLIRTSTFGGACALQLTQSSKPPIINTTHTVNTCTQVFVTLSSHLPVPCRHLRSNPLHQKRERSQVTSHHFHSAFDNLNLPYH